jgi:PQQ-like domain
MKIFITSVSFFLLFASHVFAQSPLLWERQKDVSGQSDVLRSVSTVGNTAVTAGNASVTGGLDLAVLNYSSNGDVRWTDQTPLASGINTRVFTATAGIFAFAAGYKSIVPNNSDIFVRGYNTVTGNVLWSDIIDKGTDDLPQGLAAGPLAVVVVGYGGNKSVPATALNALIRAYSPLTGRLLWENQINKGDTIDDIAWAVAIDGDEVFVAGTSNAIGATPTMIVRGYHAVSGALLWEIQRAGISPVAITAKSGRVFVAGSTGSASTFLASFRQSNGALIWEDLPIPGSFVDVQIEDHHVVAVGTSGRGSLVRGYHAANGKLLWQHITTPDPGFRDLLSAVDLSNDVAYVTGSSGQDFGYSEFLVRAYDLSSGSILFEDKSHRSAFGSSGFDIAIGLTQVYAVGGTSDRGSADFLIRAYDRRTIERKGRLLSLILQRLGADAVSSDDE